MSYKWRFVMIKKFPFPNKEDSIQELYRDVVFKKIESDKVQEIFEDAWSVGDREGELFLERDPDAAHDMLTFLKKQGVTILKKDIDYVLGNQRYFCEFMSQQNVIKIYEKSVALWCKENDLEYEEGLNMILCHEYFHYLEWNVIGQTSKRHQVYMVKIGPFHFGSTGVPSLSEIAANAFAYRCMYGGYEMKSF